MTKNLKRGTQIPKGSAWNGSPFQAILLQWTFYKLFNIESIWFCFVSSILPIIFEEKQQLLTSVFEEDNDEKRKKKNLTV